MTGKQALFIIIVNAMISILISVGVALAVIRLTQTSLPGVQPALAAQTVMAAAQPSIGSTPVMVSVAPTATPVVYIVQPGDTLSSLALKFDVSAADIIVANEIVNPDFLPAGQRLTIPVDGVPQATATWTPIPTATGTPMPFEPPSAELTVTAGPGSGDVSTSPSTPDPATGALEVEITGILGVGEIGQEGVVITNVGDQLADMAGWTLSDAEGNTYVFPNYRLWPGGNVTVHTRIGQDGSPLSSLFWGKLEAIWSFGEVAKLRNAEGVLSTTFVVGE